MNQKISARTSFFTLYILCALAFLTIHFTRMDNFHVLVGNIQVQGSTSIGSALSSPRIQSLRIKARGVEIKLRKRDRVVLVTSDNIRHPLNILGWEKNKNSVQVQLSNEASFTLSSDEESSALQLLTFIPANIPPVQEIELPLILQEGTRVVEDPNKPNTLKIRTQEDTYVTQLSDGSKWDIAKGRLILTVKNQESSDFQIHNEYQQEDITALEWLKQGSIPSQTTYRSTLEQWMDKVRINWEARIVSPNELWINKQNRIQWNDSLAVAYLADSVITKKLNTALSRIKPIFAQARGASQWFSGPYLGNIVNKGNNYIREIEKAPNRMPNILKSEDSHREVLFSLALLLDSTYSQEKQELITSAYTIPEKTLSTQEIVNRITLLDESRKRPSRTPDEINEALTRLFDDHLLPRIYWKNEGLWILEGDGVNVPLTFAVARLLIREAELTKEEHYLAIGRQMLISMMNYANAEGEVPESLIFKEDAELVPQGKLLPEEIYPLIIDNPAYPKHISLNEALGEGSWAITCAESFNIRRLGKETQITMKFPARGTHHLIIKGIKNLSSFHMEGIEWYSDPNFQRYYAGWFYDSASETLFVKIRHRSNTETIRIVEEIIRIKATKNEKVLLPSN